MQHTDARPPPNPLPNGNGATYGGYAPPPFPEPVPPIQNSAAAEPPAWLSHEPPPLAPPSMMPPWQADAYAPAQEAADTPHPHAPVQAQPIAFPGPQAQASQSPPVFHRPAEAPPVEYTTLSPSIANSLARLAGRPVAPAAPPARTQQSADAGSPMPPPAVRRGT